MINVCYLCRKVIGIKSWRRLSSTVEKLSFFDGNKTRPHILNFTDPVTSFKTKSSLELLRAIIVFSICNVRPMVVRSNELLNISYRYLGRRITNHILRISFFNHFCAGEDEIDIKPKVEYLYNNGIGSILDYAAEADISADLDVVDTTAKSVDRTDYLQARVYDYENETLCDTRADTFMKCILAVHSVSPTGFAAIKVTALGNPVLLERMSTSIIELRRLFSQLDSDNNGYISRKQFSDAYGRYFTNSATGTDTSIKDFTNVIFDKCDIDHNDRLDYTEWIDGLNFEELHFLALRSEMTAKNPLLKVSLTSEEMKLLADMQGRIHALAQLASDRGVRLMIDAEHTYFQPAIDNITTDLIKKFNREYPVIFSTYQMYLKDSSHRLTIDAERAKKGNYCFAAKLVRGAYMVLESARAVTMKYDNPVHESIEDTHDNYNDAVKTLISSIAAGTRVEVMIATHNQNSIELALQTMKDHKMPPTSNVYFGQLLGMSDNMTFTLGHAGYKAYKYVPYGKVHEVMPYLIRRAQENSDALSGAKEESKMMTAELRRRTMKAFSFN